MKKKILTAVICLALCLPSVLWLSSCSAGFNREKAAVVIADTLGFKGADSSLKAKDYSASKAKYAQVGACIARNIFDEAGTDYSFRPRDAVTRYELAKISLYSYAALKCVEVYYLEPGPERQVNDIGSMEVEQQWYIYSALGYGFVGTDDKDNYRPSAKVNKSELNETLAKVKAAAGNAAGSDYETYKAEKLKNFHVSPTPSVPLAERLYIYDTTQIYTREERILLSSMQGVVNTELIQLFIETDVYHMNEHGGYKFFSDLAVQYGYFKGYNGEKIYGVEAGLEIFKDYLHTAVVFEEVVYEEPEMAGQIYDYMLNVAANIAAVKNAIMVTPAMLERVQAYAPDIKVIRVSDLGPMGFYESQEWSYKNTFQFLRRDIVSWYFWAGMFDWSRDFNIQMKIPTIWVAGRKSSLYQDSGAIFIGGILQKYPANIPILGWQAQWVNGVEQGLAEVEGITYCGDYAKYTLGWDIVGNTSFFAGMPVPPEALKVQNVVKPVTYDPDKIYVAIANSDAGDTPSYAQFGFLYYEWLHEERGQIPRSYMLAVCNYTMNPLLAQYVIDTATDEDYLYAALSGLGYTWPFSNYGNKGVINDSGVYMIGDAAVKDYYIKTNEMMGRMNFDSIEMIIYTAGTFWQDYDYEYFEENMAQYMTNAKFFLGDFMRLISNIPAEKQNVWLSDGRPMFHCVTQYSSKNFSKEHEPAWPWTKQEAVDWLVDDILANTVNGAQFYYCLAFTWHYGPDRTKLVMEALKAINPKYEFVTTAQMYDLFRQKQALNS